LEGAIVKILGQEGALIRGQVELVLIARAASYERASKVASKHCGSFDDTVDPRQLVDLLLISLKQERVSRTLVLIKLLSARKVELDVETVNFLERRRFDNLLVEALDELGKQREELPREEQLGCKREQPDDERRENCTNNSCRQGLNVMH
jgi:hypothetical protein